MPDAGEPATRGCGQASKPDGHCDLAALGIQGSLVTVCIRSKFLGVSFNKKLGKWFGRFNPTPADKAGLPNHLKIKAQLCTECHAEEENAARAADK